jgi:hypothetical protein
VSTDITLCARKSFHPWARKEHGLIPNREHREIASRMRMSAEMAAYLLFSRSPRGISLKAVTNGGLEKNWIQRMAIRGSTKQEFVT